MGGVDVSGWTLAQRMELPDWCFGNRRIFSLTETVAVAAGLVWKKSPITLPANICLWSVGVLPRLLDSWNSYIRVGFAAAVPTSEAEMNAAIPLMPDFGNYLYTPPRIYMASSGTAVWQFNLRKGMATGGGSLVMETKAAAVILSVMFFVVYSELPTQVPAHLDPNTI